MKNTLLKTMYMLSRYFLYGFFMQFLFLNLGLATHVNGQYKSIEEVSINLSEDQLTLGQFFKEVQRQSPFKFSYDSKKMDRSMVLTFENKKGVVEDFLKEATRQTMLSFRQYNHSIDVLKVEQREVVSILEEAQVTVTGTVSDANGEPLPGVTVSVPGSSIGTATDLEGRYSLTVPEGSTLVFSFIGFESQTIAVGERSVIDVTLAEDMTSLDEVVVVGYGVQKKVNLTGSVSTIQSSDLNKRNVSNLQIMLQGKVPGLEIIQGSGQPGMENASMRLRGLGTFSSAGNSPMVLVDGVQGSLTNINPNDVESVSVLKDAASAAIYGARAANGVIIVTTKKGKAGDLKITYDANYQIHSPTRTVDFVTNSADYMTYYNEANARNGVPQYFSEEEIAAYRNNTGDPVRYPNFDWQDFMMNPANAHNHHLSVNGGNEKTRFNASLGFNRQGGVIDKHDFDKYSLFLSLDTKIRNSINYGGSVNIINRKISQPPLPNEIVLAIYSAGPHYTPYLSDGSGRWTRQYTSAAFHNRNPLMLLNMGSERFDNYYLTGNNYLDIDITDHLKFSVKGAVNFGNNFSKQHYFGQENYFFKDNSSAGIMTPTWEGVRDEMSQSILTTLYSTLNYNRSISDNHFINAIVGYNQENSFDRNLNGRRINLPNDNLTELNAGPATGQTTGGTATEWAIQSLFGRINYAYKEKYLFESSIRYDGTSRIHKDRRWGVFPSFSAGWRISQENFLMDNNWLDELKLRASYGKLGNQNIGLYPYQDILSTTGYPFTTYDQGVILTRLTDKNLKWETTNVFDIGLDLSFGNGKFSVVADYYEKYTKDILYALPIPISVGLSSPTTNFAEMANRGFELELGHMNRIGAVEYRGSLNFSMNRNEVKKVKAPVYGNNTIQEGLPWNSHYLIEWVGIFQDQADIDSSPQHPYNPKPGDLKFRDLNNDGVINSEDRRVFDGAYPDYVYGFNLGLSWKNIDFSAFFQGVKGQKYYLTTFGVDPFLQGVPPTLDFISKMWTPENMTNSAPALYASGYLPVTGTPSSYFLQDASYFRLKNININYHFPNRLSERFGIGSLDLYLSGDNLLTFTKFPGSDPERTGGGRLSIYPQITMYTFGIRLSL